MTGHDYYLEAITLRDRIISGQSNERPVMAWAAVCRACAKANDAYRREFDAASHGCGYTRFEHSMLNNLDRVWWPARAQVETIARMAA